MPFSPPALVKIERSRGSRAVGVKSAVPSMAAASARGRPPPGAAHGTEGEVGAATVLPRGGARRRCQEGRREGAPRCQTWEKQRIRHFLSTTEPGVSAQEAERDPVPCSKALNSCGANARGGRVRMEVLGRGTECAKPPECKVVFYLHNVKELHRLWLWLLWAQRRVQG